MKQFVVKEIPKTNLEISNFEIREVDVPKPSADEILVKNILLSIDAANRTWMQGRTYRDQVFAGDVMPSYSIAEDPVITATLRSKFIFLSPNFFN